MIKRFLKAFFGGDPQTWPQENVSIYLEKGDLSARIIPFGAALQDLRLVGHNHPLVLGYETPDDYKKHSPYFGATVGRFANRINKGQFEIDGQRHQLDINFISKHTLHGGSESLGKSLWTVMKSSDNSVKLEIESPDGAMGFPGAMKASILYELCDENILRMTIQAVATEKTICNFAHHSYFNLDGTKDVLDHTLHIPADRYLPVDTDLIPIGEIANVAGSPFDFTQTRPVRNTIENRQFLIDHNYCAADARATDLAHLATLTGGVSGIQMQLWSTEPGVQYYDGAKVNTPLNGLMGEPYGAHAGLCLEPQNWPDAPNHPDFPSAILPAGETYTQITELRFS